MYQTFEGPITREKRQEMLALFEAVPWHRGIEVALVGHAVAFAVCCGIWLVAWHDLRWNPEKASGVYLLGIFFLLYFLYQIRRLIILPFEAQRKERRTVQAFREAVTTAESMTVQKIEADEVVSVSHDDGTIYLFATGPHQCFWFEPAVRPKDWPNSCFEVIRIPTWKDDLGPFCRGKKLRPRTSLEFREVFGDDFDPETIPEGGLIDRSLDEFLASVR
jgi:hypothetical protein